MVYTQKDYVVSIDVIDVVNVSRLFIFRCILVKKFMCGYFNKQFKYIILALVWALKENLQGMSTTLEVFCMRSLSLYFPSNSYAWLY